MADDLPKPVWSGSFHLFGVEMRCHMLDNGQRIIEADSMAELLAAMENGATIDHDEAEAFARWQKGAPMPDPRPADGEWVVAEDKTVIAAGDPIQPTHWCPLPPAPPATPPREGDSGARGNGVGTRDD